MPSSTNPVTNVPAIPPTASSALKFATDLPAVSSDDTFNFAKYGDTAPSTKLAGANSVSAAITACIRGSSRTVVSQRSVLFALSIVIITSAAATISSSPTSCGACR